MRYHRDEANISELRRNTNDDIMSSIYGMARCYTTNEAGRRQLMRERGGGIIRPRRLLNGTLPDVGIGLAVMRKGICSRQKQWLIACHGMSIIGAKALLSTRRPARAWPAM